MSRYRNAACRVAVLLSLAPAAAGHAQRAPTPFATLEPGDLVRVRTTAGNVVTGPLAAPIGDSVVIGDPAGQRAPYRFSIPEVSVLWERGRAQKSGAVMGGIIGAAALGFLASAGCLIGRSDDGEIGNEGQWVDCALIGIGVGGLGGGLIGFGIGSAVPKWHRRYQAVPPDGVPQ